MDHRYVSLAAWLDNGRSIDRGPVADDDRPPTLADLTKRPAWHRDAACKEHPTIDFYPHAGQPTAPALAICRGCLVRPECLAAALDSGERFGIWGACRPIDRRRLRAAGSLAV